MGPEEWQRIEGLFHAALALQPGERGAFLVVSCGDNEPLRAEVESLLAASEARDGFLERPVLSQGLRLLSGSAGDELPEGKVIGPFRILRSLGKGGMGQVYLAEDVRLGRRVALKFLASEFVDDPWAKRQLIKEAQAAAMLDHPNICAVHGFEEAEGHSFIVMQYIAGETLDRLTGAGSMPPERVLSIATQIAGALAEAHAHGIIHRDIKPQNIIVPEGAQLKVLDFGLAKLLQRKQLHLDTTSNLSQASQRGLIIGTLAYMSPEQLKTEGLDYRSDVFSFGAVLYEMISGKNPHARESSAETISSILTEPPALIREGSDGLTQKLGHIAFKCLEKDKGRRYLSASEVLYELEGLRAGGRLSYPRRRLLGLRALALVAVLIILSAVGALVYARLNRVRTLAVLPIINASADPGIEYLGDGLTESLISKLSHLNNVRVKPITVVSGFKGWNADAAQIGRDLQADAVLVGRIVRQGEALVLEADMFDVGDGTRLWGERYRLDEHIFEAQERVCERVASSLRLWLSGEERKALASRRTNSVEAQRHYMEGRYLLGVRNAENIRKAIGHFDEAIRLDRAYAQAYAGLAECYVMLPSVAYGDSTPREAMPRARAAAKLALELDETLAEAHNSLAVVKLLYEWDWEGAEREFRLAIALNPDYAPARYWYSNLLAIKGRWDEFLAQSAAAKDLDPFSTRAEMNFCRAFYYTRQFDKAGACLDKILEQHPNDSLSRYVLGYVQLNLGMGDSAAEAFQKLYDSNKRLGVAPLGYAYGRLGKTAEALKILAEAEQMYASGGLPAQELAVINMGLGRNDAVFGWFEKAYEERYGPHIYVPVDPLFDSLRPDERFNALARRLNLAQPPAPN